MTNRQKNQILVHLKRGKANAMDARDIAKAIGAKRERTEVIVRSAIRDLNLNGHPICSCSKGFFIADTQAELDEYVRSLRKRIAGVQQRISALERVTV